MVVFLVLLFHLGIHTHFLLGKILNLLSAYGVSFVEVLHLKKFLGFALGATTPIDGNDTIHSLKRDLLTMLLVLLQFERCLSTILLFSQ